MEFLIPNNPLKRRENYKNENQLLKTNLKISKEWSRFSNITLRGFVHTCFTAYSQNRDVFVKRLRTTREKAKNKPFETQVK